MDLVLWNVDEFIVKLIGAPGAVRKYLKKISRYLILLVITFLFLPPCLAQASEDSASPLVFVADSRNLSGWAAWYANLYNDSRILFTLLSVVLVPLVGLLFGLSAEFIMAGIGLDLKKMEDKTLHSYED